MSSFAGMEEPYSRYANVNKGRPNWEDGEPNLLPRSPLAFDQEQPTPLPRQRRGTISLGLESNSRQSKATPPLSSFQNSRPYTGGRQPVERGVSVAIGQNRSPYPSSSKFFLTVIPPVELPHDPPHPRSQASTSSSSHIRRGTLLPLYPTLGGQLYAISREYGLPSIGGLSIYLCDDGEGNLGPRVGDAAWSALWNRFFDESADDLYVDITSTLPAQKYSGDQDRRFSGTSSSEVQSPYADQSSGIRREVDNYDDSFLNDQRRPSSSSRRTFANGYPASPMAYHTPSPRHPKIQRSVSRNSQRVTSVSTQARLPIVGRIEWAVDKNRAAWWSNWIGEADVSSERSVSSVVTSQVAGGSARKGPPRRSMHLTSSLPRPRAESSVRDTILQRDLTKPQTIQQDKNVNREYGPQYTVNGTDNSAISSPQDSNGDLQRMGYEPIDDQAEREPQQSKLQDQSFDDGLKVNGMPGQSQSDPSNGEASYENQSYAGYSALLGVDDETRAQDGISSRTEKEDQTFQTLPLHLASATSTPRELHHHFNPNILVESDDEQWREMQQDDEGREKAMLPEYLSTRSLGEQKERAAVHEWIAKTQSPQSRQGEINLGEEAEEEELLPPQDDMEEVLELWAEKTREVHTITSPTVIKSNRTSLSSSSMTGQNRVVSTTNQRNSARISSGSSKRSLSASPRIKQSPLQHSIARLADLPEEMPSTKLRTQPTFSKASLLSPIALDNSSATFSGPSAKLGNLLGTSRSTLGPYDEQTPYPYTRQSTVDSLSMPESDSNVYSRNNTLSSPRLELPNPQSPGGISRGSSSTEASDTLLDMERALALLSPAVSHKNQESPAIGTSTADSTYDSGVLTSAVRVKMPIISSKESMAKAKTLSTSVTPSPRWFRNTTPAQPRLTESTSDRQISGQELPVNQGNEDVAIRVSPRPASAFASTKHENPLAAWNYPAPVSAARLVEQVMDEKQNVDQEQKNPSAEIPTAQSSREVQIEDKKEALKVEDNIEVQEDAGRKRLSDDTEETTNEVTADPITVSSPATSAGRTRLSTFEERHSMQIYDSPLEESDRGHQQWLQPGEHLGRQGWSDTTGEASRVHTMGDSTLPEDDSIDQGAITTSDLPSALRSSPAISASFSPRSGQYATVGVQAERDDASRTDSLFSLVSDEAPGSESSRLMEGQEEEGEKEQEKVFGKSDTLQTPTFNSINTPQMGGNPRLGHSGTSSIDFQPSIQRLIRGNSFAESSEASSTHANSPYIDAEKRLQGHTGPSVQDFDWSGFGVQTAKAEAEASKEDVTIQQQGIEAVEERESNIQGEVSNDSSFDGREGEDWSQSGSEYEDDGTSGSPATRRSRLSTYSHHNAGISDAGGRTPTFIYDSHLTDEESSSRRASRRLSSNARRSSASRKSLRLSRAPIHSLEVQDALGVGLLPSDSAATISSGADYRNDLSVFGGSVGDTSFDNNRHDVISLAGETLEGHDNTMPSGFEHVSPPQKADQESRDMIVTEPNCNKVTTGNDQRTAIQALDDFALTNKQPVEETPSTPLGNSNKMMTESRHLASAISPLSNGSNGNGSGTSLRRSMGSIHEDRREDSSLRRASASATSPGKTASTTQNTFLQSPRRFKGAMLRLGATVSPNQRFRALPPSPNLPARTTNGMSPTSPSFLSNGMPHIMASSPKTFSSMDSLAITDGINDSDSTDRKSPPSPLSH